jgi:hypothetical protein
MAPYWGERGFGVLVSLELPPEWSKRKVDKLLAMCAIPGAKKPKNKPIVKFRNRGVEPSFSKLEALYDRGWGEKTIRVSIDGRLRTAYLRYSISSEYPGYGYWLDYTEINHGSM